MRASDNQSQLKVTCTILAARTSSKILDKSHVSVKLYDCCNAIVTVVVETMDKTLVQYLDNGSTRYDGKEYSKSIPKLCRESSATGPLEAGKQSQLKPGHVSARRSW